MMPVTELAVEMLQARSANSKGPKPKIMLAVSKPSWR
jgi:hypothetical protein